jgi:hypothetical protein
MDLQDTRQTAPEAPQKQPETPLQREYRKQRRRQRGSTGTGLAAGALRVARLELELQAAELEDRIRFNWQPDPEPWLAADQDFETPEARAKYERDLESGAIEVWTVRAEVPAEPAELELQLPLGMQRRIDEALRGVADPLTVLAEVRDALWQPEPSEPAWQDAPDMSSIGCIDIYAGDPESEGYRREVERDLALEAGVIGR